MKKRTIIIGIIVVVIILGIILAITQSKKTITGEAFTKKMQENGYSIADIENEMSKREGVKLAKAAASKDNTVLIQFYELENEKLANTFYNDCKTNIENQKGEEDTSEENSKKNHESYKLKLNGQYFCTAKIKKTVINVIASEAQEQEVIEVIKELGY